MENRREFWRKLWDEQSCSDDMFVQIGRNSFTLLDFSILMKDVSKALSLGKDDLVLDAGGGAGWMSMFLSPFVKEVLIFDYAEGMVEKAEQMTAHFNNIRVVHDDILFMANVTERFTKVIVASILQYLEGYGQVEKALLNIYNAMHPDGKALFSSNPDLNRKDAYIKSYDRLDWSKEKKDAALEMEDKRIWLDIKTVKDIAAQVGFRDFEEVPINDRFSQAVHMFDFMVTK